MIECINDGLSLIVLVMIPFLAVVFAIRKVLSSRQRRIHKEVGKFYREW